MTKEVVFVKDVLQTSAREALRRPVLFIGGFVIAFVTYNLFPLVVLVFRFWSWPNHWKIYDFVRGMGETLDGRGSFFNRVWASFQEPVFEYGIVDSVEHIPGVESIVGLYVAEIHTFVTMLMLPLLVGLYVPLFARYWGQCRRRVSSTAGTSFGIAVSTGSIGTSFGFSAVACCGASSGSAFLSLLGIGSAWTAIALDYAHEIELFGFVVLAANIIYTADRVSASQQSQD